MIIFRQHRKSPTKARIHVPDGMYDAEEIAEIVNLGTKAFSDCLIARQGVSALGHRKHSNKPIKPGVENGLNGVP